MEGRAVVCMRIAMRFDYLDENYLGFVQLGCILILLKCYL
jgi:hypothetical protein